MGIRGIHLEKCKHYLGNLITEGKVYKARHGNKFITRCTTFEFILCTCSSMAAWMMVEGISNRTKSNVSLGIPLNGRQASPMLLVSHLEKDLCHPLAPHCSDIVTIIQQLDSNIFILLKGWNLHYCTM